MAGVVKPGTRGQEGTSPRMSPASACLTGDKTGVTAFRPSQLSPSAGDADGAADGEVPIPYSATTVPPAAPQDFGFDRDPPTGSVVMFRGQRFVRVDGVSFLKTGGSRSIPLFHWETHCARCAAAFIAKLTLGSTPTRRCDPCRLVDRRRV